MIWLGNYISKNSNGKILSNKIGNFVGGNSLEVIFKVCQKQGLKVPKDCVNDCNCKFKTDDGNIHIVKVSCLGEMFDLEESINDFGFDEQGKEYCNE